MKIIITEQQLNNIINNNNTQKLFEFLNSSEEISWKQSGCLLSAGLLIHGGSKIKNVDTNMFKGGLRAVYGWGMYFTDAEYKFKEFGGDTYNNITTTPKNIYQFMNYNPNMILNDDITNKLKYLYYNTKYDKINDYIYKLNDKLNYTKNNKDYQDINNEIELLKNKLEYYKNNNTIRKDIIKQILNQDKFNIHQLNFINGNNGYKDLSDIFLDCGYDGFNNGTEYNIFNIDKLNDNIIDDPIIYTVKQFQNGNQELINYTKNINLFN